MTSNGNSLGSPIHDVHNRIQREYGNQKFPRRQSPREMPIGSRTRNQRVAIALDVQNLYYGAKDLFRTKVAYNKMLTKILDGRQLVRSTAYVAHRDGNNQSSFIDLLKGLGCDVKCKEVIERDSGHMKCNWDVEIAVDAMVLAPKIDVFVLASGDGDFTYLLKILKAYGVRTEVVSFKQITANALMDETDKFTCIDGSMLIDESKAWKKRDMFKKDDRREDDGEEEDGEDEGEDGDEEFYEEPEYDDSQ